MAEVISRPLGGQGEDKVQYLFKKFPESNAEEFNDLEIFHFQKKLNTTSQRVSYFAR